MEQITNDKPVRTRRSQAEILNLLTEFEKTNLSAKDFCTIYHISKATFHKWQSRYRSNPDIRGIETETGFTALQITPSLINTTAALFAEVEGIKIYQPVAASYLKELLL